MSTKILVIDDSASVRRMLRETLESDGYEVVESADGAEALASLETTCPNLVITDVYMPGLDGLSLVRGIRGLSPFRFIPILVLTTESDEDVKRRGRLAGATGWIVKPFSPDQLRQIVARILATRGVHA